MRLQDKTAFITGASKGLGRAIAERFVEEGARVVIADIDQENLDKTLAETTVDASRLTAINLDVSDFDAVQAAINGAIADFGALDILVNNAGFSPKKNWLEYEISEWQKVLDVNLSGEFFGARAVAEHMMERRSGRIINMSSSSWRHGGVASGGGMPYVSSKAGVIGLTRSLSKTLGPYNITVNAIAPGLVLPSDQSQQNFDDRQALTPLDAGLGPADIVQAVQYLIAARQVTGHTLVVDAGQQLMGFGNAPIG